MFPTAFPAAPDPSCPLDAVSAVDRADERRRWPPTLHPDLGVVSRREALRRGWTRREIDAAVRDGRLTRLGTWWLGTRRTPEDVAQALRAGSRLTCVSALEKYGVWVPFVPGRHECARASQPAGMRSPGARQHPAVRVWPDEEPIMPLRTALSHAARCLPPDLAVIVFDSVVHQGLLTLDEADGVLAALPMKIRRAIGRIDPRCASGTESRVRWYLQRKGVAVVPQWTVRGVGRTDLRVGETLIIECDSVEHHRDPSAYANDRRRDQGAMAQGYQVLRLTWFDVMVRWEATCRLLDALIRAKRHRGRRNHRGVRTAP